MDKLLNCEELNCYSPNKWDECESVDVNDSYCKKCNANPENQDNVHDERY